MRVKKLIRGLLLLGLLAVAIALLLPGLWRPPGDDSAHVSGKFGYLGTIKDLAARSDLQKPNILLVVLDDIGYGDVGFHGNPLIKTPTLDELATAGSQLSHYYAPAATDAPSRAALLSGRYAPRSNLPHTLAPADSWFGRLQRWRGLNGDLPQSEILLPEVLREAGYRTALIGQWQLGERSGHQPNDFGFELFFGTLQAPAAKPVVFRNRVQASDAPERADQLIKRYTDEAEHIIRATEEKPFFVMLAPATLPPADPALLGKSEAGAHGDAVLALDSSIDQLRRALIETGKLNDTLLLVTSDNGPGLLGNPGPHRGRKGSSFEGGVHVPFVAHWPGRIPPRQFIRQPAMGIDLFPTILDILTLPLPGDRSIDGVSLRALLEGRPDDQPRPGERNLFLFGGERLQAVRQGRYKYQDAKTTYYGVEPFSLAVPVESGPWLFDLMRDPYESYDISGADPERATRMATSLDIMRTQMKQNPRGWESAH